MPLPSQVGQTRGTVPARAPVPRHASQAVSDTICIPTVTPSMACTKSTVTSPSTSLPRRGPRVGGEPRRLCRGAAAVEQTAENVTQTATSVAEQIVNRRTAALPGTGSREAEATAAEQPPRLVVFLALVLIRQHVVGFGDLLEAPLGRRVAWILIGMVFPRQLAIGLLDLLGLASLATPRTL